MIVLNTKTFEELRKESTKDLEAIGFDTSPGSVAKLFMNIVNKNIADLYQTLTVNHLRAFVTTADGDALDAIGALLQCFRQTDETDNNYRYRITRQCLTLATSNATSIRLTVLTTYGVSDVVLKPYAMGAGSFSVILILDTSVLSSDFTEQDVINRVYTRLSNIHGYGIRYNVTTPTLTYISIKHQIFFDDKLSTLEKQEIRYTVQAELIKYLSSLTIGEDFNVDKITQLIMNVSNHIIQEANIELKINGEKALYVNQSCRWFEIFAPSNEADNVVII